MKKPLLTSLLLLTIAGCGKNEPVAGATAATATPSGPPTSTLRISCGGASAGAEITVNGQFKGECPLDLQVPAGSFKLVGRKTVDAEKERRYTQEVRVGDGVVKTVDVDLGSPVLNAAAQKRLEDKFNADNKALITEAEKGTPIAQHELGRRYYALNVSGYADYNEKNAYWQRKAAESGYAPAQVELAVHLDNVEGRHQESVSWLQRAVDQGNADAMNFLAHDYVSGKGVERDVEKGIALYRRAAEGGNRFARLTLDGCRKGLLNFSC